MMEHVIPTLNMPYGAAAVINFMLASPICTSDHILLVADAFDEMAKQLPPDSHFTPSLKANAGKLRDIAPDYAHPRGKPHGDFDGTLTP